jgi:hypothetical protein
MVIRTRQEFAPALKMQETTRAGSFPVHTAYYFLFVLRLLVCGFRSFTPGIRREPYGIVPGFLDIVQCALHQINEV